jgi:hypothetical protein
LRVVCPLPVISLGSYTSLQASDSVYMSAV